MPCPWPGCGCGGLGRVLLRGLLQAGLDSPEAILAAGEKVTGPEPPGGVREALGQADRGPASPGAGALPAQECSSEAARAAEPEVTYRAFGEAGLAKPELVVDLREWAVSFRGRSIPTRPPHNLQRQLLLALAVLASNPGEAVSMADLAEGMSKLGGQARRPVAPDARDMRYRILRPLKNALAMAFLDEELARLVETVTGARLRLKVPAGSTVVITADIQFA